MNNPRLPVALPERVHSHDARYTYDQYTAAQAAAYLRVSRNALYDLIKAGKISHAKASPTRVVCSQRDLDVYAATRRHEAAAPARSSILYAAGIRPPGRSRYR